MCSEPRPPNPSCFLLVVSPSQRRLSPELPNGPQDTKTFRHQDLSALAMEIASISPDLNAVAIIEALFDADAIARVLEAGLDGMNNTLKTPTGQ